MISIDRMELADVGNPTAIAMAVTRQLGKSPPIPVPIEEIAEAVGIGDIVEFDNEAFEGALITDSDKMSGSILCRRGVRIERRRFTVGHELGHYLNPWHVPSGRGFECTTRDMRSEDAPQLTGRPKWEAEANAFAVEVLMPQEPFASRLRKVRSLDIEAIVRLSDEFQVSKIACARRILGFEQETCAIIISRHGKMEQAYRTREFPFISLRKGMELSRDCVTRRFTGDIGACSSLDSTEPSFWTDRALRGREMFEQVLTQQDGWRLTLLVCEESEEEEDDERFRSPSFGRR